uniref:Uncharacterized protein n=1 Tax=Opuntia streptacantha TaxID=393608 RepID=A0A7C9DYL4_OPUST
MVEQNHPNWSSVIRVNHPCPHINAALPCQPRSWCNSSISSLRDSNAEISSNEGFASGGHLSLNSTGEIIAGREGGSTRRQDSIVRELLDLEEEGRGRGRGFDAIFI